MNKQREALEMALEAMETHAKQYPHMQKGYTLDAIEALREALAEPEKTNQCGETCERAKLCAVCAGGVSKNEPEPVAWGVIKRGERVWYVNDSRSICQGYAQHYAHRDANGPDQLVIPLYTAPPTRKPLTDEEISTIVQSMSSYTWDAHMLARAIERAHGIGDV